MWHLQLVSYIKTEALLLFLLVFFYVTYITFQITERCLWIQEKSPLNVFLWIHFLEGKSCISQLLTVFHKIGASIDKNIKTDILYLDFTKAFDSINHKKLLFKLRLYGVDGALWDWFSDYLSNRRQRVVIDGSNSGWTPVVSGVPQAASWVRSFFLFMSTICPV